MNVVLLVKVSDVYIKFFVLYCVLKNVFGFDDVSEFVVVLIDVCFDWLVWVFDWLYIGSLGNCSGDFE